MKVSLKAARVNADLTQKDVSKALGISNKTLINWESGISSPSAKYIDALCELYGASYNDIFFS